MGICSNEGNPLFFIPSIQKQINPYFECDFNHPTYISPLEPHQFDNRQDCHGYISKTGALLSQPSSPKI